jgi:hypothetical protein
MPPASLRSRILSLDTGVVVSIGRSWLFAARRVAAIPGLTYATIRIC